MIPLFISSSLEYEVLQNLFITLTNRKNVILVPSYLIVQRKDKDRTTLTQAAHFLGRQTTILFNFQIDQLYYIFSFYFIYCCVTALLNNNASRCSWNALARGALATEPLVPLGRAHGHEKLCQHMLQFYTCTTALI